MKHIIVGTAGHIDHGKTTLIKALTGRNTDRLKEEQQRGISIELGFTYFDLPSGKRVGIIDVPGHEKFIKNMLAGVAGIDIVLLVIAADEGVMPQTSEHLAILDLIGVEKGFVVLTKADLVDEEWLEMVKEDIRENLIGTFLENAPIIPVSSVKKTGIDKVIKLIDEMSSQIEDRQVDDMPRLCIDRVFSIQGFGTVVTGTLLSGALKLGDEVEIFPKGKIGRIRSLQVHGNSTDIAYAGQRVAINLAGIKTEEIDRGDVIAPKNSMKPTSMLDVKVKLIDSIDRIIKNRTRVRLYIGTKEILARIVLLDRDELNPGEESYAQLRLEEPIVAKREDRFILRFYSPMFTIGGGKILEPNPRKKKRFDEGTIEELKLKDIGDSKDVIEKIILDNSNSFPTVKEISKSTAMLEDKVKKHVRDLEEEEKVIVFNLTKDLHVIHKDYYRDLKSKIIDHLKSYHEKYPLRYGILKEELRSKFLGNIKALIGEKFIDLLIKEGSVKQRKESIYLEGFQVKYSEKHMAIKDEIINTLKSHSYMPPKIDDLRKSIRYEEKEVEEVFLALVNNEEIIRLNEDMGFYKETIEEAIKLITEYLNKNNFITVAEFRDLLNTNRKTAIALLEYFDQIKITKREGDKRLLFSSQ
ncbi:MAG: selenocysteine-specific translation elongation factor [Tissierellia bacterium]|nr:selenocysteine-specific translation elongation factor [Tissierellia bacterium]